MVAMLAISFALFSCILGEILDSCFLKHLCKKIINFKLDKNYNSSFSKIQRGAFKYDVTNVTRFNVWAGSLHISSRKLPQATANLCYTSQCRPRDREKVVAPAGLCLDCPAIENCSISCLRWKPFRRSSSLLPVAFSERYFRWEKQHTRKYWARQRQIEKKECVTSLSTVHWHL
jgi:hypothetical protein